MKPQAYAAIALAGCLAAPALGQTFNVIWFSVDQGGGAKLTGGPFAADVTLGQPDAAVLTGGRFTVAAGFQSEPVDVTGCEPCDVNCDGAVDAFDIEAFIGVLFEGEPPCSVCAADTNADGVRDAYDIEPFVDCLFGP